MDTVAQAENVIEKILQEAWAQAQKIKEQAYQRQAEQKAALDQTLAQFESQTQALAAKAAQDQIDHMLAAARMDLAKELLAKKRMILDEVFSQAAGLIKAMPADKYRDLMASLMIQFASGGEEVVIDNQETRIDQSLIDQVNQSLTAKGRPAGLRLAQQRMPIGAGLVLQKGKVRTNCSLDVIVAQARLELEPILAAELFA
ncbi:MAG: V-type ATP synthase subunit E family protein [Sedimentisphaerales bacterium]|jgi:V/A-type H+-transporting ATPase subunit E|nr:V-type ATP synthase subunit E family protein [Sedimentisphaerales bacterium]